MNCRRSRGAHAEAGTRRVPALRACLRRPDELTVPLAVDVQDSPPLHRQLQATRGVAVSTARDDVVEPIALKFVDAVERRLGLRKRSAAIPARLASQQVELFSVHRMSVRRFFMGWLERMAE